MLIKIEDKQFDINPNIIEAILEAEAQTGADGKEHGFLMCDTPKGLVRGKKCTGNACSINITDCKGLGLVAGSFHSHPDVISFSLGDYVYSAKEAKNNPDHKYLLCVSLLDKGVRCKALKQVPSDAVLSKIPMVDNDQTRAMIKPYYTKKVNISNEALNLLLAGTKWEDLPTSEEVCAIDEGPEQMKGGAECPEKEEAMKCAEVPGGCPWPEEPTGVYPWSTKQQYKSVKTPMGIAMEPIPPAEILSPQTEFIDIKSIETPDPSLIAMGEVKGYVNAITPVQLKRKKDKDGKWIIHDGRHRLVAWKVGGYKVVPIVFVNVPEEK